MSEPATTPPILLDPELLQRLGRIDLIGRVIADALKQGLRRSHLHGFSTEFSDFKAYGPGDDLRFLDWRIYGRTDRLLVRKYEAETSFESVLLLDASLSMAWRWKDTITKLEYAANLLAALACIHIENGDLVGLVVHDAAEARYLAPRSTRMQLGRIFGLLGEVRPGAGDTFPRLVRSLASIKKHRGQVLICSDLEEDEAEIEEALEMLAGRRDEVVVLHVLDRAEIELPFAGATQLVDSETGERLPVDLEDLRRTHRRAVADLEERWRGACDRWRIRYRMIHTGMGYLEVLLGLAAGGGGAP